MSNKPASPAVAAALAHPQPQPQPSQPSPAPSAAANVIASAAPSANSSDETSARQSSNDYQRCRCVGVLPGRACPLCSSTKWLKRCHECNGSGITFKNSRTGSEPRTERCGPCVGRGWKSAMPSDMEAIGKSVSKLDAAAAIAQLATS